MVRNLHDWLWNKRCREVVSGLVGQHRGSGSECNHEDRRNGDDCKRDQTAADEVDGGSVLSLAALNSRRGAVSQRSWNWSLHRCIVDAVNPSQANLVFVLPGARPCVNVAEVVRPARGPEGKGGGGGGIETDNAGCKSTAVNLISSVAFFFFLFFF